MNAAADPTPATIGEATEKYERLLAEYRAAMDQVESGDRNPALMEKVKSLYQASLRAHEQLMSFYPEEKEDARAADPTPETKSGPAPGSGTVPISGSAPITGSAPISGSGPTVAHGPTVGHGPTVVRRRGVSRFIPPSQNTETVPLRKDLLSSRRSTGKPQISRERKIAGGLPDWEPLPPGELLDVAKRKRDD